MAFINNEKITSTMGENGHDRVMKNFSFDAFTLKLDGLVSSNFLFLMFRLNHFNIKSFSNSVKFLKHSL